MGELHNLSFWSNLVTFTPDVGEGRDSFSAYLEPAMRKPCPGRVELKKGAMVKTFVLKGNVVRGVHYISDGGTTTAMCANSEMISSAEPYHLLQLLQPFKIRTRSLLKENSVAVEADLPVRQGFITTRPIASTVRKFLNTSLASVDNDSSVLDEEDMRGA